MLERIIREEIERIHQSGSVEEWIEEYETIVRDCND